MGAAHCRSCPRAGKKYVAYPRRGRQEFENWEFFFWRGAKVLLHLRTSVLRTVAIFLRKNQQGAPHEVDFFSS
jgi:hypothetical protein